MSTWTPLEITSRAINSASSGSHSHTGIHTESSSPWFFRSGVRHKMTQWCCSVVHLILNLLSSLSTLFGLWPLLQPAKWNATVGDRFSVCLLNQGGMENPLLRPRFTVVGILLMTPISPDILAALLPSSYIQTAHLSSHFLIVFNTHSWNCSCFTLHSLFHALIHPSIRVSAPGLEPSSTEPLYTWFLNSGLLSFMSMTKMYRSMGFSTWFPFMSTAWARNWEAEKHKKRS